MSRGRGTPNLWGGENYRDANGKKAGYSMKNGWGGYNYYDNNGKKIGYSIPNGLDGYKYYDNNGKKQGSSLPNIYGGLNLYDNNNKKISHSEPRVLGHAYKEDPQSEGCYIATCVYGSYDCPEVWTLRRFRDHTLGKYVLGRTFIRAYYAVAPNLVRRFGSSRWFRRLWQRKLNRLVSRLQANGVAVTPYQDENWRRKGLGDLFFEKRKME